MPEASTSSQLVAGRTFKQLFDLYMSENVIPQGKRQDNFLYFYKKHGVKWATIPVEQINKIDVLKWRNETAAASGSAGAQRALDTMSAIITWAMNQEIVRLDRNPCKHIQRFKSQPRDRFLSLDELEHLDRALSEESALFEDFFLICLLTGARRGNVLSMRWDSLDLESALWHIAATEHKNRQAQSIVLTDAAVNLLNQRKCESTGSTWVFPSPKTASHLKDPRTAWERVCKRAGLTNARIHDLRRTLGSYLAMQGESAFIIGKMLGHRDYRSTAVYARLDLNPVRIAAESVNKKWNQRIAMPARSDARVPKSIQFQPDPSNINPSITPASKIQSQRKLDQVQQIIAEGRMLSAMRAGVCTRKGLYKKFAGRDRLQSGEMSQLLEGLISRGLVIAYQTDLASNQWRYRLVKTGTEQAENSKQPAEPFRYTRVKHPPAPLNMLFVEQKILQSIREGRNTKSQFWWKFDGRTRLKGIALDEILKDMISRNLILPYRRREGSTVIAYRLVNGDERAQQNC